MHRSIKKCFWECSWNLFAVKVESCIKACSVAVCPLQRTRDQEKREIRDFWQQERCLPVLHTCAGQGEEITAWKYELQLPTFLTHRIPPPPLGQLQQLCGCRWVGGNFLMKKVIRSRPAGISLSWLSDWRFGADSRRNFQEDNEAPEWSAWEDYGVSITGGF